MVKFLFKQLATAGVMDKDVYNGLWKSYSYSPKRINVLIWVMIHESLNCSSTSQKVVISLPFPFNLPFVYDCRWRSSAFFLWMLLLFFACWKRLLSIFHLHWVFGASFKENVLQAFSGPSLKPKSHLLWINVVKALLAWTES